MATIDLWNASSNAITQPTELPTARHALCGAAAGSRVFFGGGWDNTGSLSSVVEILDLTTMTWSTAAVALSGGGRASLACSSFTVNGGTYVMFAGGVTSTSYSDAIDIYDATGTYLTTIPPTTTPTGTTPDPSLATTSPQPTSSSVTPAPTTTTSTLSTSTPPSTSATVTTTTTPAPTVVGGCQLPQPLPSAVCVNATWVVAGSVVLNDSISITTLSPISVEGNLTITNGVTVTIAVLNTSSSFPIITSLGCVQIDPNTSLVLDLGKTTPVDGQSIAVIEASQTCGGILGNFSSVQAKGGTLQLCQSLSSSQVTSNTQLTVLLSVRTLESSSCRKKSNKVAIVAGCVVGGAILLILLALLFYYVAYVKRWIGWCDCLFRSPAEDDRRRSGSKRYMVEKRMAEIDTN